MAGPRQAITCRAGPEDGSATLPLVQEVPSVFGHQDGVDRMDHAVVGRNIAEYARPLIGAPRHRSGSAGPRTSWR